MKIIINTDEELMKKTIKNFYEVFKYKNELKNKKNKWRCVIK